VHARCFVFFDHVDGGVGRTASDHNQTNLFTIRRAILSDRISNSSATSHGVNPSSRARFVFLK